MMTERDEKRRSILWRGAMAVSTALIIIIFVFFILKLFTSNPLEGRWISEENDMTLYVGENDRAVFSWRQDSGDKYAEVSMKYELDKSAKTFTLHMDEQTFESEELILTDDETAAVIRDTVETMETSYNYSIESNRLTLTDREFGEQLIFNKD